MLYNTTLTLASTLYLCAFVIFIVSYHPVAAMFRILPEPSKGTMSLYVRKHAKIPDYEGSASSIVGIIEWKGNLYVTTSVSGGLIYKVSWRGVVEKWFDVNSAMSAGRRVLETNDKYHGGVRGLAFHPTEPLIYVSLLESVGGDRSRLRYLSIPPKPVAVDSVVLEFRLSSENNQPMAGSLREVLRIGLTHYDHPIKQMTFSGGLLYIGHGDGSVQSAFVGGGQNNDALGKIIRIDPRKQPDGAPYGVPPSNPYVYNKTFLGELFAVGFRNPHNLCFSKVSNDLFVADAGRDNVEEINIVKPGGNYGWAKREGAFTHLESGGLGNGVSALPSDDMKFGYIYPNIALGHVGERGWSFQQAGQAIAGSCPIENGSPLNGIIMYGNFPTDGALYYSYLNEVRGAVTAGPISTLKSATVYQFVDIYYDHDSNPNTPFQRVSNFRDIVRYDRAPGMNTQRADLRFGRGAKGEIYMSSKQNGWIYVILNSFPL